MIAAIMKQPRFFYVKSSGNQHMRLSSSALAEMDIHQINMMDPIKKEKIYSAFFARQAKIM